MDASIKGRGAGEGFGVHICTGPVFVKGAELGDILEVRHFLMTTQGLTEDEAISLMTVGVDFGITQVVDGNWGVYGIVKKALFAGRRDF